MLNAEQACNQILARLYPDVDKILGVIAFYKPSLLELWILPARVRKGSQSVARQL